MATDQLFATEPDRWALISHCGRYRYGLSRTWDEDLPTVTFVMLNPSTADATVDDPTIRRCTGFAKRWGAGGISVVNLFAWRSTDPSALPAGREAVGDLCDEWIVAAAHPAATVVAAWGAHPRAAGRDREVLALLQRHGHDVVALGITKDGAPRHPLYVRGDVELVPFGGTALTGTGGDR